MKTYITSDTHFGHKNIINYENRPFKNTEEMDNELIKRWNNVVGKDDIVYHLGDFGFCNLDRMKEIVGQLNGRIRLVIGNHDNRSYENILECGFDRVYDKIIITDEFFILSHAPVYMNENMPYANIYGHVHGSDSFKTISKNSACVCVERWNYTPVDFEAIKTAIMNENKVEEQDSTEAKEEKRLKKAWEDIKFQKQLETIQSYADYVKKKKEKENE